MRDSRQTEAVAHETRRCSNPFTQFLPVITALNSALDSKLISRSIQRCLLHKIKTFNSAAFRSGNSLSDWAAAAPAPRIEFLPSLQPISTISRIPRGPISQLAVNRLTDSAKYSLQFEAIRSISPTSSTTEPSESRPVKFPTSTSKYNHHGRKREQIPSSQP